MVVQGPHVQDEASIRHRLAVDRVAVPARRHCQIRVPGSRFDHPRHVIGVGGADEKERREGIHAAEISGGVVGGPLAVVDTALEVQGLGEAGNVVVRPRFGVVFVNETLQVGYHFGRKGVERLISPVSTLSLSLESLKSQALVCVRE